MEFERHYQVRHENLAIDAIVTHPQMRITIDEKGIEELAENIRYHGLIYPLCVAIRDEGYVLISGHRRLRACRLLQARGEEVPPVPAAIFEGIDEVEFALLQASENIHEQVPPHEAAKFYEATWKALKMYNPSFHLVDFARAVGRSEETVRAALRFALLPESIKGCVASKEISYGSALELSRLQGVISEAELLQWVIRISLSKRGVPETRAQVSQYLQDISAGQLSLLDIFEENARYAYEQASRRTLIDRETVQAFWGAMGYLERLLQLFEDGKLEREDFPLLRRAPRHALLALVSIHERTLNYLEGKFPDGEVERAKGALRRVGAFCTDE